jgi:hypothetical protein
MSIIEDNVFESHLQIRPYLCFKYSVFEARGQEKRPIQPTSDALQ